MKNNTEKVSNIQPKFFSLNGITKVPSSCISERIISVTIPELRVTCLEPGRREQMKDSFFLRRLFAASKKLLLETFFVLFFISVF